MLLHRHDACFRASPLFTRAFFGLWRIGDFPVSLISFSTDTASLIELQFEDLSTDERLFFVNHPKAKVLKLCHVDTVESAF